MKETSTPINFTVELLEQQLKDKKVTATIRRKSFIKRHDLKVGTKIEVKFKRKRIGIAIIRDIRFIGYTDLFTPEIIKKEGFDSAEKLINALKPFWRYHWNRVIAGKTKMPVVEFEWV